MCNNSSAKFFKGGLSFEMPQLENKMFSTCLLILKMRIDDG